MTILNNGTRWQLTKQTRHHVLLHVMPIMFHHLFCRLLSLKKRPRGPIRWWACWNVSRCHLLDGTEECLLITLWYPFGWNATLESGQIQIELKNLQLIWWQINHNPLEKFEWLIRMEGGYGAYQTGTWCSWVLRDTSYISRGSVVYEYIHHMNTLSGQIDCQTPTIYTNMV